MAGRRGRRRCNDDAAATSCDRPMHQIGAIHWCSARIRCFARQLEELMLEPGLTLWQTAGESMVHLNGVEPWRQRWNRLGLTRLYEGRHTGRPRKWTPQQR